jgi:hypothetical protein
MVPRVPFCRMAVGRLHLYDANAHERGKLLGAHRAVAVHEHDAGRRRRAGLEHHRLDIIVGRHTAVARKGRGEGLAFSFLVECIVCLDDLERAYWMGTEIGELGGYGFQGVTLGVDGSCKDGEMAENSGRKLRANVRELAERRKARAETGQSWERLY